jgi:hypothetical protein
MARVSGLVLGASVAGSMALGFILGGGTGWHLMDNFCGRLVTSGAAAISGDSLARHIAMWDSLQSGDAADADRKLRFLIESEARQVQECHADPECARLMPDRFDDPELLKRAEQIGNLTKRSSGP